MALHKFINVCSLSFEKFFNKKKKKEKKKKKMTMVDFREKRVKFCIRILRRLQRKAIWQSNYMEEVNAKINEKVAMVVLIHDLNLTLRTVLSSKLVTILHPGEWLKYETYVKRFWVQLIGFVFLYLFGIRLIFFSMFVGLLALFCYIMYFRLVYKFSWLGIIIRFIGFSFTKRNNVWVEMAMIVERYQ